MRTRTGTRNELVRRTGRRACREQRAAARRLSLLLGLAVAWATGSAQAQVVLFADGFESGTLSAGGWSASGDASISTSAYEGSYSALIDDSGAFVNVVDTTGHAGITLEYARYTYGYDFGEALVVEWSTDGSSWTVVEQYTGGWALNQAALPAQADDQATLYLRF
ncbi:MAG TPA: hypothetical protein ENO23_09260, partial [Alphaproteobacteria bacterium]|nr:hypothetical protein [Alphaproteobacteria bacterium]